MAIPKAFTVSTYGYYINKRVLFIKEMKLFWAIFSLTFAFRKWIRRQKQTYLWIKLSYV